MLDGICRPMQNAHALRALLKNPLLPPEKLAIGGDDQMQNIPLLIFCDQHLPIPGPTIDKITNQSYEKMALDGQGDYVTIDNFVTDDFDIGRPVVDY